MISQLTLKQQKKLSSMELLGSLSRIHLNTNIKIHNINYSSPPYTISDIRYYTKVRKFPYCVLILMMPCTQVFRESALLF